MNDLSLANQLSPPRIIDDSGVALSVHHLEFVEVDAQAIGDWRARRAPLGMPHFEFQAFRKELFKAFDDDGFIDVDVRLKGSAAAIFSGRHKTLPFSEADLVKDYTKFHGIAPNAGEVDAMMVNRDKFWALQPFPRRRPFDSMHKLAIESEPSDFDIQVSSSDIQAKCEIIYQSNWKFQKHPLIHREYGFLTSSIVSQVIPYVMLWADAWTKKLKRSVNVKVFPGAGPPNITAKYGELSSHHRANDWMIVAP